MKSANWIFSAALVSICTLGCSSKQMTNDSDRKPAGTGDVDSSRESSMPGSKWTCVTSTAVPGSFYMYDNHHARLSLYRLQSGEMNAARFIKSTRDSAFPANLVPQQEFSQKEARGGSHFWIKPDTKDLLYIPILDVTEESGAQLRMDGMSFDGVQVKEVTYHNCGGN